MQRRARSLQQNCWRRRTNVLTFQRRMAILLLITASCSTRQKPTDMRLVLSMGSMVDSMQKPEIKNTIDRAEQRLQDISQCCDCGFGFGADLEFKMTIRRSS